MGDGFALSVTDLLRLFAGRISLCNALLFWVEYDEFLFFYYLQNYVDANYLGIYVLVSLLHRPALQLYHLTLLFTRYRKK
jgi:hypothetical protein